MSIQVKFAVYGALRDGNENQGQTADVTERLQQLIDESGGIVTINNNSFGDPCPGFGKHFGALLLNDGTPVAYACGEGQTVDFLHWIAPQA